MTASPVSSLWAEAEHLAKHDIGATAEVKALVLLTSIFPINANDGVPGKVSFAASLRAAQEDPKCN